MSGDKPVISPRPFSPAPLLLRLGVWGFLCRGVSALLAPSCVSAEEPDRRAITEKPGSLMCGADIFSSVGEPAFFPGYHWLLPRRWVSLLGSPGLTATQVQKPGRGRGSSEQRRFLRHDVQRPHSEVIMGKEESEPSARPSKGPVCGSHGCFCRVSG